MGNSSQQDCCDEFPILLRCQITDFNKEKRLVHELIEHSELQHAIFYGCRIGFIDIA